VTSLSALPEAASVANSVASPVKISWNISVVGSWPADTASSRDCRRSMLILFAVSQSSLSLLPVAAAGGTDEDAVVGSVVGDADVVDVESPQAVSARTAAGISRARNRFVLSTDEILRQSTNAPDRCGVSR